MSWSTFAYCWAASKWFLTFLTCLEPYLLWYGCHVNCHCLVSICVMWLSRTSSTDIRMFIWPLLLISNRWWYIISNMDTNSEMTIQPLWRPTVQTLSGSTNWTKGACVHVRDTCMHCITKIYCSMFCCLKECRYMLLLQNGCRLKILLEYQVFLSTYILYAGQNCSFICCSFNFLSVDIKMIPYNSK